MPRKPIPLNPLYLSGLWLQLGRWLTARGSSSPSPLAPGKLARRLCFCNSRFSHIQKRAKRLPEQCPHGLKSGNELCPSSRSLGAMLETTPQTQTKTPAKHPQPQTRKARNTLFLHNRHRHVQFHVLLSLHLPLLCFLLGTVQSITEQEPG